MWVVPCTCPDFILMNHGVNGVPLFVMLIAIFSTLIQTTMGAPFYVNSYKSLKNKSANMDVLVMLGTTSAWLYAMVLVFFGYSYEYR
jgi:cation transport ATPase